MNKNQMLRITTFIMEELFIGYINNCGHYVSDIEPIIKAFERDNNLQIERHDPS